MAFWFIIIWIVFSILSYICTRLLWYIEDLPWKIGDRCFILFTSLLSGVFGFISALILLIIHFVVYVADDYLDQDVLW